MPAPSPADESSPSSAGFKHLRDILDPDGIVAALTVREEDGRVSFALLREYSVGGKPKRTAYLKRSHIPALRRLLDDLEVQLELEEDRQRTQRRSR
jgi:hypothetical protein